MGKGSHLKKDKQTKNVPTRMPKLKHFVRQNESRKGKQSYKQPF